MKTSFHAFIAVQILTVLTLCAQNNRYYRISLSDKQQSAYTLSQPEKYLSQKALERRIKYGIRVDSTDLPISQTYVQRICQHGLVPIQRSRWMNTLLVAGNDSLVETIKSLPFVSKVEWVGQLIDPASENAADRLKRVLGIQSVSPETPPKTQYLNYGNAADQINLMHGQSLHQNGFYGQGVTIAIIDAGFVGVDRCSAFEHLRKANKILGVQNFWTPDTTFFYENPGDHGAMVFSCMGSLLPGKIVGTAPQANYILLRSEVSDFEQPVEEDLWVAAAEYADSIGVDLINTSLGYTTYDQPFVSHTYADLNGKTAFISCGANIAANKGMLVINSAGNSGRQPWYHIGVPADAEDVFSVGAVDAKGEIAPFSSRGSTYDCRLKPNISAMGVRTTCMVGDSLVYPNGTSFSSPILAGMMACLWQAFPNASPKELKDAVMHTASMSEEPNVVYGYGVPNFEKAMLYLEQRKKPKR